MASKRPTDLHGLGPTAERQETPSRLPALSFVVQKHAARRLHYDLRLEMEGVLRSWAVTRGPSLHPGERRLAVQVEDHSLAYGRFEGIIPRGSYGAGTVMLWDRGTWEPVGDAARSYAEGRLDFTLRGEKLRGRWHLVRMKGPKDAQRQNWLLIKADDAAARQDGDILADAPLSVDTGRDMAAIARDEAETAQAARPGTRQDDAPSD